MLRSFLDAGKAYPCFCTPDRLDQMRKEQQEAKQAPMYDRKCLKMPKEESLRRIAAGEKHVIRMEIPRSTTVTFNDDIGAAFLWREKRLMTGCFSKRWLSGIPLGACS